MKWFKHMVYSHRDEKLALIRAEFGLEGYGMYWMILELIAEKLDEKNETSLEFSEKIWRNFLGISAKKFKNFLIFAKKINIFSIEFNNSTIRIDCPNLLKYKDEWTRKKQRKINNSPELLRSDSGAKKQKHASMQTELDKELKIRSKTTKLEHKSDFAIAIFHLRKLKINDSIIQRLISQNSEEYLIRKIAELNFLMKTRPERINKNPAGYLIKSIEDNYVTPAGFDDYEKNYIDRLTLEAINANKNSVVHISNLLPGAIDQNKTG